MRVNCKHGISAITSDCPPIEIHNTPHGIWYIGGGNALVTAINVKVQIPICLAYESDSVSFT